MAVRDPICGRLVREGSAVLERLRTGFIVARVVDAAVSRKGELVPDEAREARKGREGGGSRSESSSLTALLGMRERVFWRDRGADSVPLRRVDGGEGSDSTLEDDALSRGQSARLGCSTYGIGQSAFNWSRTSRQRSW